MTEIREEIVTFLKSAPELRGSHDAVPGSWPEKFGPVILPFCDGAQLERTSIYLGDENGSFEESFIQSGAVGYRWNRTIEIVMTVAPHSFSDTMLLARLQVSTVLSLYQNAPTMAFNGALGVLLGEVIGPNPTGTDEGVYSIATITLGLTDFL